MRPLRTHRNNAALRLINAAACLLLTLCLCAACSENEGENHEFDNWEARNIQAFADTVSRARAAIAQAKATYGDDWAEHCSWRLYRSYRLTDAAVARPTDTVAVRIINTGTGSGCPIYTDSVNVNFIGRLIPSESYPEGYVFGYTGLSADPDYVFSKDFCRPAGYYLNQNLDGFTTAVTNMHIGDLWRVFIPSDLAYGESGNSSIPGYSMLIYDVELKSYFRAGSN